MFERQEQELWEYSCWEQDAFDELMAEREDADRQKRIHSSALCGPGGWVGWLAGRAGCLGFVSAAAADGQRSSLFLISFLFFLFSFSPPHPSFPRPIQTLQAVHEELQRR